VTPTLVVDANLVVRRDWHISSPWWSVLLGLCATNQIRLIVPEIVIREVVGNFARELASPSRELGKLGVGIDSEHEKAQYEAELRSKLVNAGATIADSDPISVLELADRAIRRVRPFNDQGNGFRDSVIWAHVLEAALNEHNVVFISNDSGFCEGKGADRKLHPDLLAEAEAVGDVSWFADIGVYLESTGRDPALNSVEAEVLELIVGEWGQVAVNLATAIEQSVAIAYGTDDAHVAISEVGGPIEVLRLRVVRHPTSDNSFVVGIDFRAPLTVDVEEATGDYSEIHQGVELSSLGMEVEVIYDKSQGELGQFVGGLVELDWDRVSAAIAKVRGKKSGSSQPKAFEGLDLGPSEAVMKAFEGLDLGPSEAVMKAFEGLDLGPSEAVMKAFEGFDLGPSEAVRKAFEGLDLGPSEAVRKAFEGLDLGPLEAVMKAFEGLDFGYLESMRNLLEGFQRSNSGQWFGARDDTGTPDEGDRSTSDEDDEGE